MHKLIRQMIKEELSAILDEKLQTEAAVTPASAASDGLALMSQGDRYVLYDAKAALKVLSEPVSEDDLVDLMENEFTYMNIPGQIGKTILGVLSLYPQEYGQAFGANQIQSSAAKAGYGPLMYDIALADHAEGITPDRQSVTSSAAKVWSYYMNKRSDVTTKPLDNAEQPRTNTKQDDSKLHAPETPGESPLDQAYYMTSKVPVSPLRAVHKKFLVQASKMMTQVNNTKIGPEMIEALVDEASTAYFQDKYYTALQNKHSKTS